MDTIDSNAWSILANLLDMASDEFGNHGCGDFELPNTAENRMLVEAAEILNSPEEFKESGLNISKNGAKIYTQDNVLMAYFAHLAHKLSGKEE